ncbi:MAG TPA: class III signal peptide-containing protein [Candidatus Bathyarchaeia archaeon]|nr:class III signal peptide-containing protein [Candidatus Bathyarchaeia archaeon]
MKQHKKKKGQSTLEYIILVTGVIAVLLLFLNPNGGLFRASYNATLAAGTNGMEDMANRLRNSRYDQK